MAEAKASVQPRGARLPQLHDVRLARYWSQSGLARKAGVSTYTVCRAERGDVMAFDTIHKLAAALGVTPGELCALAPVETVETGA